MREFLEKHQNRITEAQARDILVRCLKCLYFRDGRAYDKVITFKGVINLVLNV